MLFVPAPPPPVSYSKEIAPVLAMRCNSCHGDAGGLSTRSHAQLMAGGNKGVVILPGNASDSLLVHYVDGRRGENHRMPLGGKPLTTDQIQLIRRWIDEGARDDRVTLPRYLRNISKAPWPPDHDLAVSFRLRIDAYVTFRIRHPLTGRVLVEQIGPVKREREDPDLGVTGSRIEWNFHRGVDWPSTVDIEMQLEYAAHDPGDIRLTVRAKVP